MTLLVRIVHARLVVPKAASRTFDGLRIRSTGRVGSSSAVWSLKLWATVHD